MTHVILLKKLYAIRQKFTLSARSERSRTEAEGLKATSTVVLVTGVFDLLHQEHIKLLHAAKKQGKILLVGLEPDSRVSQLKGQGRPLNSIATRLKHLAALNLADYVFELPANLNTSQGREDLIKKLKPHILAVSTSTPNLPEKRRIMKLVGGKVKIVLPHNQTISTTQLLK